MDFNTDFKIVSEEDYSCEDLINIVNEYLEERDNDIDSVHKIYFEELLSFLNKQQS